MAKRIYAVNAIIKSMTVQAHPSWQQDISLEGFADGCHGALICFTNKKKAMKFARSFEPTAQLTKFMVAEPDDAPLKQIPGFKT